MRSKHLRILIVIVATAYCVLVLGLFVFQRRLLFLPDISAPDPVRAGVPNAIVERVMTDDGLPLLAWYRPPPRPDGFTVLFLHGNGGNIAHRAGRIRAFEAIGWGILLLEYRGYGGNPGSPSEDGLFRDARAGLAKLRAMGVASDRMLVWGESLGTGLAVLLGAENTVAAVLLDAPYTSVAAAAQLQYPFVPVRPLLRDRFDSLSRIARVRAPILVMQGSADKLVPPAMGRALIAAATAPTELWVADGAGHDDLAPYGAIEAADAFVRRHCPL